MRQLCEILKLVNLFFDFWLGNCAFDLDDDSSLRSQTSEIIHEFFNLHRKPAGFFLFTKRLAKSSYYIIQTWICGFWFRTKVGWVASNEGRITYANQRENTFKIAQLNELNLSTQPQKRLFIKYPFSQGRIATIFP